MAHANVEVPDEWIEEANERDLSIKEYCHRMIRAGRRQFGAPRAVDESSDPETLKLDDTTPDTNIDDALKRWILTNLSTDEAQDMDDLVALLEDDIATLADELCDERKAKYRRSKGGYIMINE